MCLDYFDDLVRLCEPAEHVERTVDRLSSGLVPFGVCFAPSNAKRWRWVLLQDWKIVFLDLMLRVKELTIFDRFAYLGSCVTKDDETAVGVDWRKSKIQTVCAELKQSRCLPDVPLKLKGRVLCHNELITFVVFSLLSFNRLSTEPGLTSRITNSGTRSLIVDLRTLLAFAFVASIPAIG